MNGPSRDTRARCERHLHNLERAHPRLRDLAWRAAPLDQAPLGQLTSVIRDAWHRAYGNRVSIAYGSALFHLACACYPDGDGLVSWAEEDGQPLGVIFSLPLCFETEMPERPITASLTTGLCCAREWEGRGMIEMLMARHGAVLVDRNHAFSLHWRATETREIHGAARLSRARIVRLLGRAIRPAIASRHARGGLLTQLGIRLHALRYPSGRSLPSSWTMETNTARAAFYAERLVRECFAEWPVRRRFPAAFFHALGSFQEDGLRGTVTVFHENQEPVGVIWGCVNPADDHAFFLLDGMVFRKDTPPGSRSRALSCLEGWLGEQGCFAALAPESVFYPEVPPGWLTLKRYAIGAIPFDPPAWLTPGHLSRLFLELR